jgi:hypothetical protein
LHSCRKDTFQHGTDGDPRPFWDHTTLDEWRWFAREIAQKVKAGGYRVVLLDVISDWWSVENENSPPEVGRAVAPFARVAETAKCCVLAVAHSPKYGKGVRGSNSFPAKADTIIEMTGDERTTQRQLTIRGRYGSRRAVKIKMTDAGYMLADATKEEMAEANRGHCTTLAKHFVPIVPKEGGWTEEQAHENWPKGHKRPARSTLRALLRSAVKSGLLKTEGGGTKADPTRFLRAK